MLPRIDKWDKGRQADDLRMFLEGVGLPRIRFHDLRALWATMEFYIRKAGVNISGITDCFKHHHCSENQETLHLFSSQKG